MDEAELKQISHDLTKSLDVTIDVDKLQQSVLEKTKLARLLVAVDDGVGQKYAGKQLTDLYIDGNNSIFA